MTKRYFFVFIFLLILNGAKAQLETGYFEFKIKQIDEFFARFNFDTSKFSYLSETLNKIDPAIEYNRKNTVKSLFNREDTTWNIAEIIDFVENINSIDNPALIDFYDNNWYAEINYSCEYNGEKLPINIILKNQKLIDGKSYWTITAIKADFLEIPTKITEGIFLNPSVHGTNFLALSDALSDTDKIRNYLPLNYDHNALSVFAYEIYNGNLKIKQRNTITYHFLQVENWIFTVDYYNRNTYNSGWLISNLIKAGKEEKLEYKKTQLNISM